MIEFSFVSVTVKGADAKTTGKRARIYDKRQSCYYCRKIVCKVARHYQTVHAKEKEVAKALKFRKNSNDRKKELERLRLLGNYQHNLRVLETKCGQLIVVRRPSKSEEINGKDFLPCSHCFGFLRKSELWRHNKCCPFKNKETDGGGDNIQQKSKMLLLSHENTSDSSILRETFASMKSDEITTIAQSDHLIRRYGAHLAERNDKDRRREVSQGMRQLSRLLLELRRNGTETFTTMSLQDYMKPEYFDRLIASVKTLCNLEESGKTKAVSTPSLALKLGFCLKKCIAILRGKALREKDDALLQDQTCLDTLMVSEWNERISHRCLSALHQRKFNQTELLPLTSDLEVLRKHLLKQIAELSKTLREAPTLQVWKQLAEATLTRLIIFNKRRGGEASKLLISSFKSRPNWKKAAPQLIEDSLQPIEKELCKR